MNTDFLIYGANGYSGEAVARLAVKGGLLPLIAGRNADKITALAQELGVPYRVFDLSNTAALDEAFGQVKAVLHCAGPFAHTFKPVLEGCLRSGVHYLDITGEISVLEAIASCDAQARAKPVMLMPAVGFDVVPTDCLALYLKQRLPSATHLALAFCTTGPAGIPPGTANTAVELLPLGVRERRGGKLEFATNPSESRMIDFGNGPRRAILSTWGDSLTAYWSTGIPNIRDYLVVPASLERLSRMATSMPSLFALPVVQSSLKKLVRTQTGSTAEQRAKSRTYVWGQVTDDAGHQATARLSGPEVGMDWTAQAALTVVRRVLDGDTPPGFQTPARAYGADLVMQVESVTREDVA